MSPSLPLFHSIAVIAVQFSLSFFYSSFFLSNSLHSHSMWALPSKSHFFSFLFSLSRWSNARVEMSSNCTHVWPTDTVDRQQSSSDYYYYEFRAAAEMVFDRSEVTVEESVFGRKCRGETGRPREGKRGRVIRVSCECVWYGFGFLNVTGHRTVPVCKLWSGARARVAMQKKK